MLSCRGPLPRRPRPNISEIYQCAMSTEIYRWLSAFKSCSRLLGHCARGFDHASRARALVILPALCELFSFARGGTPREHRAQKLTNLYGATYKPCEKPSTNKDSREGLCIQSGHRSTPSSTHARVATIPIQASGAAMRRRGAKENNRARKAARPKRRNATGRSHRHGASTANLQEQLA
jgi:hypothetical protein